MGEEQEAATTEISQLSTTGLEKQDENTLNFLDSVDNYLILIETLSSTLREGWLELASARHSMGASRVNSAMLNLKHHSAATKVEVNYDNAKSMAKSPEFSLCKWASSDNKDSASDKENFEELKENSGSENQEGSLESSNLSGSNASQQESNGSETTASPRKTLQKERAKVLSVFGTLVSPKLRASQLSFETALERLVEIANVRSSILETHRALLHKE